MSDLAIALAGGAVGALLAAVFAQAGRAWAAGSEVTLHDDEAAERNRRPTVWTDDRTRALEVEAKRLTSECNSRGQSYSGHHGAVVANAKAKALQQYRDEEERAKIDLAGVRANGRRVALAMAKVPRQAESVTHC
jgi:hypothetical protein